MFFAVIAEMSVRSIPNTYKYKCAWMKENHERIKTLAIGASYINNGICPSAIGDSVYNLAMPAQTLEFDYKILKKYIPLCKNLRYVLISADHYNMLAHPMENSVSNPYRPLYYQLYMNIPTYPFYSPRSYEIADVHSFRGKLVHYFISLCSGDPVFDSDSLGWRNHITLKDRRLDWKEGQYKEIMNSYKYDCSLSELDNNVNYLIEISNLCKEAGVSLIVVSTPKSDYFVKKFPDQIISTVNKRIENCSEEYGFTYRDYYDDKRFVDDDFISSDHLSDIGAIKFSKILKEDIKGI